MQLQTLLHSKDNQNDYSENNPAINAKSFTCKNRILTSYT